MDQLQPIEESAPPARTYHHGNLRVALLEAGLEICRVGGPAALSLREATRRVGVSPNAVYRHFTDRADLLLAVRERLQLEVAAWMRDPLLAESLPDSTPPSSPPSGPASGRAALRAVGLGYITFALREPGWFETAFGDLGPGPYRPDESQAALPPPLQRLVQALDEAVADGSLHPDRRVGAEWSCWSTVHGFAALALHGPLRGQPAATLQRTAERVVDDIIAGLLAPDGARIADQ